ncbi:MAG: helix-turn-helix domain-containing protein [Pseudonocardiaceae bacterium]
MNQPAFGDELRRLRLQRGLSLKKFAQLVHYDPGYLSKIENGLKPPTGTVAGRCDAALEADGTLSALAPAPTPPRPSRAAQEVRIPVVIEGRPMLLPIKLNVELSVAPAGNHDRTSQPDLGEALSRGLPGSSAIVLGGAGTAWQWELPSGRAFGGASLPAYLGKTSWSTGQTTVIADRGSQSLGKFVSSAPRGVIIAASSSEPGASHVLLDVIAARKQIPSSAIAIPQAFQADDVTLGILWALSNMDEALLNDDDALAQARQCVRSPEVDDAAITSGAELSTLSRMWLGSDSCARFIVSSTRDFSNRPALWTREQRGEEASTWLFFKHKLDYLQATSLRFTDTSGSSSRTFCVPELAVLNSASSERILLLLAAALMESLGIRTEFCPDPALSEVDGFVLAPGSEAVIANWVRTDGRWYVDKTKSKPVIQAFGDVIGHARAHGLSDAANPATRLAALADYLNIDWTWLTSRCCALAEHSCRDFARPRSRLLSIDGVDTACRYVASLHHEPTSASG